MSYWIDTVNDETLGIGICGRCSKKLPLTHIFSDPNAPGVMVCEEDLDEHDPYRLPPRQTERINLDFVRPDVSLVFREEQRIVIVETFNILTEAGDPIITESGNHLVTEDAP